MDSRRDDWGTALLMSNPPRMRYAITCREYLRVGVGGEGLMCGDVFVTREGITFLHSCS